MKQLRSVVVFVFLAGFAAVAFLATEWVVVKAWRWLMSGAPMGITGLFIVCVSVACAYVVWEERRYIRSREESDAMYHPNGRNLGVPRT